MAHDSMINNVKKVEQIASASKMGRLLKNPLKYIHAILFRELVYKNTKREKHVMATTFFGVDMHLLLPSSTDIYLTGGKSHDSETRLAKFLIHELQTGDTFVDVGAHYGYFSLLAAKLVGDTGTVYSFEASPTTYSILNKNATLTSTVQAYNLAVSDSDTELTFYEFPNLYSEYNTSEVEQFEQEEWFQKHKPRKIRISTTILDQFLSEEKTSPSIIKIDVEGAEHRVIAGLRNHINDNAPAIVMEYLSAERGNVQHKQAEQALRAVGYHVYAINPNGKLTKLDSVESYLTKNRLDSDNIVFRKRDSDT